jgi:tryptophan-rich sensory protein
MINKFMIMNILIPIFLALFMNGIIYTFGINKSTDEEKKYQDIKYDYYKKLLPKGYIIGTIWVVIFGILGYVHYLLLDKNEYKITFSSLFVILIIIYCLLYPLITNLKVKSGLILNLIALLLSFILGLVTIMESKYIFIFTLPLILWISFVNIVDTLQCSQLY